MSILLTPLNRRIERSEIIRPEERCREVANFETRRRILESVHAPLLHSERFRRMLVDTRILNVFIREYQGRFIHSSYYPLTILTLGLRSYVRHTGPLIRTVGAFSSFSGPRSLCRFHNGYSPDARERAGTRRAPTRSRP